MEHFDVRRALKMRVVRKSLANEGVGGGRGRKTDRALSTDALFHFIRRTARKFKGKENSNKN